MSEFVESEADESSAEEMDEGASPQKIRKKAAIHSDSDEEEDDDDEDRIKEEMKDIINDEEESSGSSGSSSGSSSSSSGEESETETQVTETKKRRHDTQYDNLEDDDYDLIEENLGVKVQRKKKLKRVKVLDDDEEDEDKEKDKDELAQELFEDGEEGPADSRHDRSRQDDEDLALDSGSDEDDVNDFIVDDNGDPIAKTKKRRYNKLSDHALQEAQDIFGTDFDFEDVRGYDDEYEESDEEEEYEDEEDPDQVRHRPKAVKKKSTTKKSIFEVFEPIELERGHFTDRDQEIRSTDEPERFQLRGVKVSSANEQELGEEAEWIYAQCFQKLTISVQECGTNDSSPSDRPNEHHPIGGKKGRSAVAKICEALRFMRNQQFEVPFIAFYRKEYLTDLSINDLWIIYKWDERWCQLKQQKDNMQRLFKKMQEYICEQILNDDTAAEHLRQLEDSDFERLKEAQSPEELKDVYLHFLLYYAQDLPAMQEANLQKKKRQKALDRQKKLERQKDPDNPAEEEDEEDAEDEIDEAQLLKRSRKKDCFAVCREMGLGALAKKFGLTPQQFGENLRDNYQRHEVVQFPVQPLEAAAEFVNDRLKTAEETLKAARYMVACEIARDPSVRRCVRDIFFERAKLSVYPTKKGIKEIDEAHNCYPFKYLKNKPVRSLQGDTFLKLSLAEEEKLVKLSIKMDGDDATESSTYASEIRNLYHRDEFSKNVQQWNQQREDALIYALTKLLYPAYEKELKLRLIRESYDHVLRQISKKLYNWLKIAPYNPPDWLVDEEDFDTRGGVRVLAISYQNDWNVPAFGALINGDGEVTDYLRLENILKRKNSWRESEKNAKLNDMNKLKKFLEDKKPHVVVVAAESREAISIKEDVEQAIKELGDEEQFPAIQVMLLDNGLANVYAISKRAETDFREYPPLLKQAVSLARRMQDPLVEFSQLCGPDEEILCLKYHPLQENVPKEEFQWAVVLELINRTSEVGVDINRCVEQPHTSGLLQFVSGLGARKATAMIKSLKQSNSKLESRTSLVTNLKLGPKVFLNCAGFIKIDSSSFDNNSSAYTEMLDGSRVHPEMYEWARKMATDALEYDDNDDANLNPADALEEILENPEKLKDLDLDAFAVELERQGFGNKCITLYDIRAELNHRYKDLRSPYIPPEKEILFHLLTKETPETFYVGKLITCQVSGIARKKPQGDQLDQANPIRNDDSGLWQCPFCLKNDFPELSEVWNHFDAGSCPGSAMGVKVRFDNGVNGFIPTKNLSDKRVSNPEDRVKIGQIVHGRLTKIDITRFSVDVTTKSSDLADVNGEWKPRKDMYYDHEAEDKERKKADDSSKLKQRQTYVKRVIVHPSFHNVSFKDAVKILSSMDQGDCVIRPSSKGVDHLTCTWKVYLDILQHIDIKEKGKENSFSLGSSLVIDNEEFECLDEILANYVQPMAGFARDLINFKNFYDFDGGKRDQAEKWLSDEKRKAPNRIPYCVSASSQYPGKFLLSYQPSSKARHEFITVTPTGFRYRQQMFSSLNAVFRWFKDHFRDPIPQPQQTPSAQSVQAATTPYLTPGLTTPSGRMSVVPMIIATPGVATPGARTPGSIAAAAAPYVAYTAAAAVAGYSAFGAGYNVTTAALTPQPMQISTTPGYVTPAGYAGSVGATTPQTSGTAAPPRSQSRLGLSPRPASRNQRGPSRAGTGRSAEEWKKMAADWASNKAKK